MVQTPDQENKQRNKETNKHIGVCGVCALGGAGGVGVGAIEVLITTRCAYVQTNKRKTNKYTNKLPT